MCNSNVQLEERQEGERGEAALPLTLAGPEAERQREREARWAEAERQAAAVGKLCLCLCRQINRLQRSKHSNALWTNWRFMMMIPSLRIAQLYLYVVRLFENECVCVFTTFACDQ